MPTSRRDITDSPAERIRGRIHDVDSRLLIGTRRKIERAWRDEGRGLSWGIMCRSRVPLKQLRRHFKRFLVAKLPDGSVAQFRFYDPRVFGRYLPTCTPEELALWFDGVSAYLVENQELGGFHEFTLHDGRLYDQAAANQ